MDDQGNLNPPQNLRASRLPAQQPHRTWTTSRQALHPTPIQTYLAPSLALLFVAAWLLAFPRFWTLIPWLAWSLTAGGFLAATLGLLMLGLAIGHLISGRHHHG